MAQSTVAVIDYGMGNLHSVASALATVDASVHIEVTADHDTIVAADRVIFPGVGAIRDCMAEIRRLGLDKTVAEVAASDKPLLGICVGMQALLDSSEENNGVECLAILPGQVRFFGNALTDANGERLKVPHMGWNQVRQSHPHPMWDGIADNSRFYFVHSYYADAGDNSQIAAQCDYGLPFSVALAHNNIFAVQFHPEKSSTAGLKLLANFLRWDGK
ncbi:MAG: imidazole glycerol phosphate synthase subunit HisH [Pseudomonadales bacterium]